MIYSKKHPRHNHRIQVSQHDLGTGDFTIEMWIKIPNPIEAIQIVPKVHASWTWSDVDLECTSKKLAAIGVDPAFIHPEHHGFAVEDTIRALDELQQDYEAMFPGDDE